MTKIISDKAAAQRIATKLHNSIEPLSTQETIQYAQQTTLSGNPSAHNTIKNDQQQIDSFFTAMQQDIKKIELTDKGFTKKDPHRHEWDWSKTPPRQKAD